MIDGSCLHTCIKVIERPPEGAAGDVGEQRCHIAPVEPPQPIGCKDLHRQVPRLPKSRLALGSGEHHFGFDLEAGQLRHAVAALHHQVLGDHVDRHGDGLGHQGRGAPRHQGLHSVAGRVMGHELAHEFVGGDVRLSGHQGEGVDHEAAVEAADALRSQDLKEGIKSAGVHGLPLLHLQAGADQAGWVGRGPGGEGHEHAQGVELPLVQVLPLDDLDGTFLQHGGD